MGKPIIAQRRGKGSPTYRVPNYHFQPLISYKNVQGKIVDIVNDPRRTAPLAKIKYADGSEGWIIAAEGMRIGDDVQEYVKPLNEISAGTKIFCVEITPNFGPQICRSSGSFAILVSKDDKNAIIQLPSRKKKVLSLTCRATIGVPAGGGRQEKPWIKAGKKWHAMHARGKLYPRTSGVKMNAVDHPFGGKSHRPGRSKSVSRNAPPGRKVGSIASKRTGRRKR